MSLPPLNSARWCPCVGPIVSWGGWGGGGRWDGVSLQSPRAPHPFSAAAPIPPTSQCGTPPPPQWGQWGGGSGVGAVPPPGPFLLCALLYPLLQDLSSGRCSPHPPGEVEKRPLLCPHPTPGPPQSPPWLWDPHLHHNYAKPALLGGGCIWGGRRGGCAVSPSVMSPAWHGMLLGCSQCSSVVWGERGGLIQPGFAPHMHPMPARRKLCG